MKAHFDIVSSCGDTTSREDPEEGYEREFKRRILDDFERIEGSKRVSKQVFTEFFLPFAEKKTRSIAQKVVDKLVRKVNRQANDKDDLEKRWGDYSSFKKHFKKYL